MEFRTKIVLGSKTATGFQVPDEVVEGLGSGKTPSYGHHRQAYLSQYHRPYGRRIHLAA